VQQAEEVVAALAQRLPKDPETQMLKGVVARAAGNPRGAREAFLKALELDRDFFPPVEELAVMDVSEGKFDAARTRLQEVLRRNRNHLSALIALARLEVTAGRPAEALSWARQAADANPKSLRALLLVAEAQLAAGELDEAMVSARRAIKEQPRNAQALRVLGQVLMAARDYAGAVTAFSSLLAVQPTSIEAHLLLANAQLASGDQRTATSVARAALKRSPRSPAAAGLLADVLLQSRKYTEALEFARQVQRDNPQSAVGFRLEGEAALALGDPKRSMKAFQTAAKLDPTGPMLAKLHHTTAIANPGTEQEGPLEEWVKNNPSDRETRAYLAAALATKGRHKDAIGHLEELVRQNPKDAKGLNDLAWVMQASGDTRAIEFAERAYQLSPTEPAVLDTYGWVLVNRGRLQEGIPLLLKAVAQSEKNPELRYRLARALAQAGDKTRARTELKAALNTGIPFPQAEEARKLLVSLGN